VTDERWVVDGLDRRAQLQAGVGEVLAEHLFGLLHKDVLVANAFGQEAGIADSADRFVTDERWVCHAWCGLGWAKVKSTFQYSQSICMGLTGIQSMMDVATRTEMSTRLLFVRQSANCQRLLSSGVTRCASEPRGSFLTDDQVLEFTEGYDNFIDNAPGYSGELECLALPSTPHFPFEEHNVRVVGRGALQPPLVR
jgi:hypothetical protein